MQTQDNVLYSMTQDNDVLEETVHDFTRAVGNLQANQQAPQIFCFYENKATNTGAVVGRKDLPLVSHESNTYRQLLLYASVLTIFQEFVATESSATLSGHQKRALDLDHFNLNKFEDDEDQGYVAVMREIVEMADASKDIISRRGLGKRIQ